VQATVETMSGPFWGPIPGMGPQHGLFPGQPPWGAGMGEGMHGARQMPGPGGAWQVVPNEREVRERPGCQLGAHTSRITWPCYVRQLLCYMWMQILAFNPLASSWVPTLVCRVLGMQCRQ